MLECWNEHPIDRPTFSDLRAKFSDMLLATTTDTYMILEVDDKKSYYTVKDEDEEEGRDRSESVGSTDSDSSLKKKKKAPEKPVWKKPTNPYVDTPANRLETMPEVHEDEQPLGNSNGHVARGDDTTSVDSEDLERRDDSAYVDQPRITTGHTEMGNGNVTESTPEPVHEIGIPISMITNEKPIQDRPVVRRMKSNPYVDSPNTGVFLPDPDDDKALDVAFASPQTRLRPLSEEMGLRFNEGEEAGTML